ncbi:MAG: hypothetical protein LBU82_07515 [Treponema sp.]|nr:hypothetical protein [Treponema sp.]
MNRRIIIFTVILILASANVFAQLADGISFNAWGRGVFLPLIVRSDPVDQNGDVQKDNLGNTYAAIGSTRGGKHGFEQELYLKGDLNYVGFQLGLTFDGEAIKADPPMSWYNYLGAAIWVKPFGNEWLKVTGGTFLDETLRGKIGEVNGGWENFVLPKARYKDDIFNAFGANGIHENVQNLGLMLSSSPLEGLFIGARVNAAVLEDVPKARAESVYRFFQLGAGYEISGIGHVRLQYLGGYLGKESYNALQKYIDDEKIVYSGTGDPFTSIPRQLNPNQWHGSPARMEAAFALKAVENLLVDFGLKCYFPVITGGTLEFPTAKYEDKYLESWGGMAIGAGAIYDINAFNITGRVDSTFGAYKRNSKDDKNFYDDSSKPLTLDIRLVPSYDLGSVNEKLANTKVGLDFGFAILEGNKIDVDGKPYDPSTARFRWGIGAFISKNFSNGYIKTGVTYTSPTIYENKNQKTRSAEDMVQIPLVLEYNF